MESDHHRSGPHTDVVRPDQQPTRVFLDNNIWNHLVDGTLPFAQADLTRAFRNGSLVIVGTLEETRE